MLSQVSIVIFGLFECCVHRSKREKVTGYRFESHKLEGYRLVGWTVRDSSLLLRANRRAAHPQKSRAGHPLTLEVWATRRCSSLRIRAREFRPLAPQFSPARRSHPPSQKTRVGHPPGRSTRRPQRIITPRLCPTASSSEIGLRREGFCSPLRRALAELFRGHRVTVPTQAAPRCPQL
jgi:hypothetical protein